MIYYNTLMRTRVKKAKDCIRIFDIKVSPEEMQDITDGVCRELNRNLKLPGFRPGRIPREILERFHDGEIKEGVLKEVIPIAFRNAMKKHKLTPASLPRVSDVKFYSDRSLTFELYVDVLPDIRVKKYKGIRVEKHRISVSKDELNKAIWNLRNYYAEYIDVERPVKKGDYVVCDITGFVEGRPVTKEYKNIWILADNDGSMFGIGESLIGLHKWVSREIEKHLTEDIVDKKFAGKTVKFVLRINEIKEKRIPELNDEFAKKLNMENIDELKREIENQLMDRKEKSQKIAMENQILEKLIKDNKFPVPLTMVERQKKFLMEILELELRKRGLDENQVKENAKRYEAQLEQDAINKVKTYFILNYISEKERIFVTEEDLNEKIKTIASSTGKSEHDIRKQCEEENLIEGLKEEIIEDKVLNFLFDKAEIVEKKN